MAFEWRRLFENVASSIVHVDQRCNTKDVGRASAGRVDKAAARSFDDLLTHFWGHARKKCEAGQENSHGVVERTAAIGRAPSFPGVRASAKCFALWLDSLCSLNERALIGRGMSVPLAPPMPVKCLAPGQKKAPSFRSFPFGSRWLDRRPEPRLLLASACRVG
jgi:hypothetical protein